MSCERAVITPQELTQFSKTKWWQKCKVVSFGRFGMMRNCFSKLRWAHYWAWRSNAWMLLINVALLVKIIHFCLLWWQALVRFRRIFIFSAARKSISGIILSVSFDFSLFFSLLLILLLASHSFRLSICAEFVRLNTNQLRRRILINLSPSSRHLSTGRRSNLCAKLCRHTGHDVLFKKGR